MPYCVNDQLLIVGKFEKVKSAAIRKPPIGWLQKVLMTSVRFVAIVKWEAKQM